MKKICTLLSVVGWVFLSHSQVVINEVYGGGGNTGTIYKQDFVELYNKDTSPVTLSNVYLQYGGAGSAHYTAYALPATIVLASGQHFLIQCASGANGTVNLVNPDYTLSALSLSSTGGKVALTTDASALSSPTQNTVIDLLGWSSSANMFEGPGPATGTSSTTSIARVNGADTNNNAADFVAGAPTPYNSHQEATLKVHEKEKTRWKIIKNALVSEEVLFGVKARVKIWSMEGRLLKDILVDRGSSLAISAWKKGTYILEAEMNGQKVTQKMIKK